MYYLTASSRTGWTVRGKGDGPVQLWEELIPLSCETRWRHRESHPHPHGTSRNHCWTFCTTLSPHSAALRDKPRRCC